MHRPNFNHINPSTLFNVILLIDV
jgi:hypothetical protein